MAPDFRVYQEQILKNARALAQGMKMRGYRLVAGGTDNHMVLIDLTDKDITGQQATGVLEKVGITVNKNLIPYDEKPAKQASGIRIGSPALTSRGMREQEMDQICEWMHQALSAHEDEAHLQNIHKRVHELCDACPLYQRSYHM
jgi:glycine hydroxymethyltransferase